MQYNKSILTVFYAELTPPRSKLINNKKFKIFLNQWYIYIYIYVMCYKKPKYLFYNRVFLRQFSCNFPYFAIMTFSFQGKFKNFKDQIVLYIK